MEIQFAKACNRNSGTEMLPLIGMNFSHKFESKMINLIVLCVGLKVDLFLLLFGTFMATKGRVASPNRMNFRCL